MSTIGYIHIKNLKWGYPAKEVFSGITTSIKTGSFTSIIGPNGVGKTTFLRLLTRWLIPAHDTIFINGKDINHFSRKELGKTVAFVKQDTGISVDLPVIDIVLMGRYPHINRFHTSSDRDKAVVMQALEQTHIYHLKDRALTTLSSGEIQRVYIARALAQQTDILLLDEPIAHLDLKHQIDILKLLKRVQQEREMTVVSVLHDLNYAAQCSDRIVLFQNGKIFSQGSPQQVLKEESIKAVYGITVKMSSHPESGLPYIMPLCF
jgi:iron complex transport system ATP-binding protein